MAEADSRTIEQRLKAKGYGHRRDAKTINTGAHEIFVIKTGKVVGRFTAHEAVDFLARIAA